MSDMRKLLESMDKFAGEKVGQKPGDQVRGTEKATKRKDDKHPFAGRLVGASESKNMLADLERELKENNSKWDLAREFTEYKHGVAEARRANTDSARAEFSNRPRKPGLSPAEQDKAKADSDAAWERLMAYADEQKKKEQDVTEMDGDGAGRDGSNRKSHSTYGSRDKHNVPDGPDIHLGPDSMMTSKDIQDRALDALKKTMSKPENMAVLKRLKTKEGVAEGVSTMWEVCFDYGPHMSDTVKVKAGSEDEAIAKVEKAAEKRGRSIDINWVKPAEQGVAEGSLEEVDRRGFLKGMAAAAVGSIFGLKPGISTAELSAPQYAKVFAEGAGSCRLLARILKGDKLETELSQTAEKAEKFSHFIAQQNNLGANFTQETEASFIRDISPMYKENREQFMGLITTSCKVTKMYMDKLGVKESIEQGVAEGLNDTQKKIEDTINKLEDRLKHAKSDEQWDRISARIERLQAGLKRSKQGVAEGFPLGKALSFPDLVGQVKHILDAKHRSIGWKMSKRDDDVFLFSAMNDYDVRSMLIVAKVQDGWVSATNGFVDPYGKTEIFDKQELPMTLASASEIADEAIQTFHDIDLSDYADEELDEQGLAEARFDGEEFRRHMKDLEAREELRKTDPVSAKALDLRGQLPQQSKKKPEDDSIGINDPRHPGYAYTQAGQSQKIDEFAPGAGDDREPNEEDVLLRFAKMWYSAPDVATQRRVEQALARQGWEIGELESEEGGAYVMRVGDEEGDSYIGWSEEQLADIREGVAEASNPEDTVTLDIPLLIRLLEYSREDAKTDMDLHNVAERLIVLSSGGQTLSMKQYDQIIPGQEVDEEAPPAPGTPGVATAGGPAGVNQPKQTTPGQPVDPAQVALQKQQQAKLQQNLAGLKTAGVQIDPAKAAQTLQKTDTGAPMNAMDKETISKLAPAIGNVMSNPSTATQLNTLIQKAGGGA